MEKKLAEAMSQPKVQGVVCSDMQGMCLGHKGKGNENLAGPIAALCDEAAKQWPSLVSNLNSTSMNINDVGVYFLQRQGPI